MMTHHCSNQHLIPKGLIGMISLILMSLFYSCGGSDTETTDQTGGLAFNVEWVAPAVTTAGGNSEPIFAELMELNCESTDLTWVKAVVYNRYDELLAESPRWECSAHAGTIEGVKKGMDRWVIILGTDETHNLLYRGQVSEVEVNENEITDVGLIIAHYFIPTGGSYSSGTDRLTWLPVIKASSYEVQVSSDSAFTLLSVNMTVEGPTSGLLGLGSGHYYFRIRAIDYYNYQSVWSQTWEFDVP